MSRGPRPHPPSPVRPPPESPVALPISVAVALLSVETSVGLTCLLVRAPDASSPTKETWLLPHVGLRADEPLDRAADRLLSERARSFHTHSEPLGAFSDPRGEGPRTLIVAYLGLTGLERMLGLVKPGEVELGRIYDPARVQIRGRPVELAVEHATILRAGVERLRRELDAAQLGQKLLPPTFTLFELQCVYETVLGKPQNKPSFRRRMLASGWLEPTHELKERGIAPGGVAARAGELGRPAQLYRVAQPSARKRRD